MRCRAMGLQPSLIGAFGSRRRSAHGVSPTRWPSGTGPVLPNATVTHSAHIVGRTYACVPASSDRGSHLRVCVCVCVCWHNNERRQDHQSSRCPTRDVCTLLRLATAIQENERLRLARAVVHLRPETRSTASVASTASTLVLAVFCQGVGVGHGWGLGVGHTTVKSSS